MEVVKKRIEEKKMDTNTRAKVLRETFSKRTQAKVDKFFKMDTFSTAKCFKENDRKKLILTYDKCLSIWNGEIDSWTQTAIYSKLDEEVLLSLADKHGVGPTLPFTYKMSSLVTRVTYYCGCPECVENSQIVCDDYEDLM